MAKDLNGSTFDCDRAAWALYRACRDEFDCLGDVYHRMDYLQILYDEEGVDGFMEFFRTDDADYIALHKALVFVD